MKKNQKNNSRSEEGDIEGIDGESSESWGDYPLDTVLVRKDTRTVGEIVARIKKNRYVLDPDFQREFVWTPDQQIRLIESSLMRIPLPVLYVAEDTEGRVIVVDGLQRLTTFYRFLEDKFELKNIGGNSPESQIKGKRYSELPLLLQERIHDTQLTLYILDPKAPERARLDIFERVNGGVPLTRQQMRNCLYNGKATKWLKFASRNKYFLEATGKSLSPKTMRDREAINRFCAFYNLDLDTYKGDMDDFLAKTLTAMNDMTDPELENISANFNISMQINFELFGKHSFRKSLPNTSEPTSKSPLNISLFDTLSTAIAKNQRRIREKPKEYIKERICALIKYSPFSQAISSSTNGTAQVKLRHTLAEKLLGKNLDNEIHVSIFELAIELYPSEISASNAVKLLKEITDLYFIKYDGSNNFFEFDLDIQRNIYVDILARVKKYRLLPASEQSLAKKLAAEFEELNFIDHDTY